MPYTSNCGVCGKFIAYSDLQKGGGGSSLFVPSSDISYEEIEYRCKKCTEKHGKPVAKQRVKHELTSWVH